MQYFRSKKVDDSLNSISIVCLNSYPIFNTTVSGCIGGMETRAALFGRELLITNRWMVRFLVNDYGQSSKTVHDGITFDIYQPIHTRASLNVNPRFTRRKWFPALNLDRRDLYLLWQLPIMAIFRLFPAWFLTIFWRRRRSEVVCCFGNNGTSAQVIADCRRLGIPTVLCIASDEDLSSDYVEDNYSLNDYNTPKWMSHFSLEMADHVLVQTESQLRTLKSRFNRHGELVRNPVKISETDMKGWGKHDERETILWIGRTDMFHKRPLLFLELAKRCPDLPFVMIVNNTNDTMFTDISTKCPPNLTIVDYVPHKEIWDYYRRARVFVSTSASGYEGFPNTFLQCAVTGVPMASLEVDPEGIFSQKNCGLLSGGSMDKLESDVRFLWSDEVHAQRYTKLFYKYTLEHHSLGRQVDRFEKLLQKVIDAPLRTPMLPWWKMPFQRFVRRLEI